MLSEVQGPSLVAVGRLDRQLPVAGARTPEPWGAVHTQKPSVAELVRRQADRRQVVVAALEVALPLERLLGSTADKGRGPCTLSSHHDRLIFHSGYTRTPQVGWGDNSIAPVGVLELGLRH